MPASKQTYLRRNDHMMTMPNTVFSIYFVLWNDIYICIYIVLKYFSFFSRYDVLQVLTIDFLLFSVSVNKTIHRFFFLLIFISLILEKVRQRKIKKKAFRLFTSF